MTISLRRFTERVGGIVDPRPSAPTLWPPDERLQNARLCRSNVMLSPMLARHSSRSTAALDPALCGESPAVSYGVCWNAEKFPT